MLAGERQESGDLLGTLEARQSQHPALLAALIEAVIS